MCTRVRNHQCEFIFKLKSVSFPQLVYTWPADKRLACWQSVLLGTASGHVNEPWECDHHVQANIRHVYLRTNVCQLNQSWKQYDNSNVYWTCIIVIADEWKTNLMSLAILFHFLCAQHIEHIRNEIKWQVTSSLSFILQLLAQHLWTFVRKFLYR